MRRCIRRGSYPFLAAGSTRHCTGIHHDFGATMETTIAELYRQCTFPLRPNKTNFHGYTNVTNSSFVPSGTASPSMIP